MMNARRLRLESLEERTFLAVTAGGGEQTAAALPAPTEAVTWTVNTTTDPSSWNSTDTVLSLREALGRASAKDRIVFSQSLRGGTIKLSLGQLQVPNGITIDATSIGGITIDGCGKSRVFYIFGGTPSAPVELVGLTITGGNAAWDFGGGIYNYGTLKITRSTVSGNSARDFGGGIYNCKSGNMTGDMTITGSTVSDNSAATGGGIYNDDYCTVTVSYSAIAGNSAGSGGGIYNKDCSELMIANSVISGNSAQNGGGIYNSGIMTVSCSAFYGNTAANGGGIYSNEYGIQTITYSTVSGNAAGRGGGIYSGGGELTLTGSIVSLNCAEDGNSDLYNMYCPVSGGNNIIGSDPCFVTAPVFESGVLINLDELDLSLSETSWGIDRGTNSTVETDEDILGNPRIYAAWKSAATVDIGAYEYQDRVEKTVETPSLTVTTTLDVVDDTDNLISLREAVLYANAGGVITFDASLAGKTIVLGGTEIFIDRAVSIDATGINGITIDGDGKSRVFNVTAGTQSAPVKLINLTVTGGSSSLGGAILCSGTLTITNSAIAGNSAESGGGVYNSGELTVMASTVSGNSAGDGGGIYNINNLTIANSIVSLNYAAPGGQRDVQNTGSTTSRSNMIGTDPVFRAAPVFDEAGNLLNFDQLDLALSQTSQAIDAGDNRYVTTETDLAGNARIFAAWKTAATVDIGAYEYPERIEKEVEKPSLTVTTALDIVDDTDFLISLREAILYANAGDVITFDASLAGKTIVLNGTELFIDRAVTIDATGIKGMTIDGNGESRVFSVAAGTGSMPVKLICLTVTGGNSSSGGGIDNAGTLTIADLTVFGNSAGRGGGIANSGSLTVADSAVSGNSADSGGGIYNGPGATLTVTDSVISGNSAEDGGGGIYSEGPLRLTKAAVSLNSAGTDGGGIYCGESANLKVAASVISGNSAEGSGGGVCNNSHNSPSTIVNSALFGNSADRGGGICNTENGGISVVNLTISGNSARHDGGGIYNENDDFVLANSIIALNYAGSGRRQDIFDLTGHIMPDYCEVGMDPDFITGPVFDTAGNLLNFDSIDLTLSATSMAIDSGDDYYVETETDLAGKARIAGEAVDIGAYEFLIWDSAVVTTNLDTVDFRDNLVSLREAVLCTTKGGVITFASSLAGKKIRLGNSQIEICEGVTIDASGIGGITIDAHWGSRAFYVSGGTEEYPVELIGITVSGGYDENGGAIYKKNGTLILTDCTFTENSADANGGAIYNRSGPLAMTGCAFDLNTAYADGGGVFNFDSLTMADCSLTQNAAFGAGAIRNDGVMTMTACTVTENEAFGADGGAIFNSETLTMTNCNVSMNSADTDGGGIYNNGALAMTSSTLSGNSAASGGGIYNGGTLTMTNSIAALNSSKTGGEDIYRGSGSVFAYNALSSFTDWTESANCLVYNPSKPLFENAGGGDYSLAQGSQAVNKGNNSYVAAQTDLAGNPRIVGGIVDMGAYEYQGSTTEQLEAPAITTGDRGIYVSYGANRHLLQWTAVDNASGYEVQYSAGGSSWTSVTAAGTDAVIRGLAYGADVTYRVRALGDGVSYTDSEWSRGRTFNVCPMDINNDGDIGGLDRNIVVANWGVDKDEEGFPYYADINADGDVGGLDRNFIVANWGTEADEEGLVYPAPAADMVFAAYEPGDLDIDFDVF